MKKYFVTGLVILLPVVLTVWIFIFLVEFFTRPFTGWLEGMLAVQPWAQEFLILPGAKTFVHYLAVFVVLICLFLSTVLLGMFGRWFLFRSALRMGDVILHKIPFVNKVYKTSQDIIKTVFASKSKAFKKVVMVPFPEKGVYSVGFVSGESPAMCRTATKADLLSVFVPTTPNPTSGYLVMYPREECVFLDMKVEEAIKFIISCGVIHRGKGEEVPNPTDLETEPLA